MMALLPLGGPFSHALIINVISYTCVSQDYSHICFSVPKETELANPIIA